MAESKLNENFQQIKQLIIEMPLMKKLSIVIAFGVVVASMIVLLSFTFKSNFQTLYTNLKPEDITAITGVLDKENVPYEVQSATKSILVPGEKVLEVRRKLAQSGLPKMGGVGFEIFDNKSFGMTEFEQRLNFQRALQGELERTINDFHEIGDSRVHLVLPAKTVFARNTEPPSASIVLKLESGQQVRQATVTSIIHLVSSSVPNLMAKNVTVVDTVGRLLSEENGDELSNQFSSSFRKKEQVERTFEKKVKSLMEPIIGFGKVQVRVTANLDFTAKETTEEKYDPDSVAIKSEKVTKLKESGSSGGSGGAVTAANQGGGTNTGGRSKDQSTESIDYEVSKQIQRIVEPVGKLNKLSVAVLVDGVYKENEDGKMEYVARSDDELKKFEELIKSAIGFDVKRGDQLKVMNLAFQSPEKLFATSSSSVWETKNTYTFYLNLLTYLLMALIAVLTFLFVIRPLILSWREKQSQLALAAAQAGQLSEEQQKLLDANGKREDIQNQALDDPESMVKILRKWLE